MIFVRNNPIKKYNSTRFLKEILIILSITINLTSRPPNARFKPILRHTTELVRNLIRNILLFCDIIPKLRNIFTKQSRLFVWFLEFHRKSILADWRDEMIPRTYGVLSFLSCWGNSVEEDAEPNRPLDSSEYVVECC